MMSRQAYSFFGQRSCSALTARTEVRVMRVTMGRMVGCVFGDEIVEIRRSSSHCSLVTQSRKRVE